MNENIFTSRTMWSHQEGKKHIGSLRVEQILYDKTPDPFSSRRDGSWMGLSENGAMATPVSDLFSPLEQKSESLIVRFIIRDPWWTHLACKLGNIFFFYDHVSGRAIWLSTNSQNDMKPPKTWKLTADYSGRLPGIGGGVLTAETDQGTRPSPASEKWFFTIYSPLWVFVNCLFNGTTKAYSQGDCNSTDIYIYA